MSEKIIEAWKGPGKKDGEVSKFKPEFDALHIDMKKKGNSEWWYFDAHLDNGLKVFCFFRAKHERTGRTGVEITIYKPNGEKIQKIFDHERSDFFASRERPDVKIGNNLLKADYSNEKLPTFEIFLEEADLGVHFKYTAIVEGWMPGKGYTQFGSKGHFGWCVAIPRAEVEGTLKFEGKEIRVHGIGYHDHNWISFNAVLVIQYWYWGRMYSENFTLIYAYIKCSKAYDGYPIKVLMLAKGSDVIMSTGEFDLIQEDFHYNNKADSNYPGKLEFKLSEENRALLEVQEIIDADNLLFELSPILRFIVKSILRKRPGYFRFRSNFKLTFNLDGESFNEDGSTLHEMVIAK